MPLYSEQLGYWPISQHLLGVAMVSMHDMPLGGPRLSYDEGEDEESFEWVDFRELTDQEVRQHPSYVVVQPRPPPAPAPSAAAGKPAPKAGSSNTEQVTPCTAVALNVAGAFCKTAAHSVKCVMASWRLAKNGTCLKACMPHMQHSVNEQHTT